MKTKISIFFSIVVLFFASCADDKAKSNKFTLQASNNMYVVINPDSILVANEPNAEKAEVFEKVKQPNGKWAIKTSKDKYICDDRIKNNIVTANRTIIGDWEQFEIIRIEPTKINLKSLAGKYVCADLDSKGLFVANRDAASDWEAFTIEKK